MAVRTPFSYRPGATVLHRAPAGLKLLCVIAVSIAASASVIGLAVAITLVIAAAAAARIYPWELLRGSRPLALLSLCIVILNLDVPHPNVEGLIKGGIIVLRVFTPFAAAALLFSVTTMRELRLSLAALELRFRKGKPAFISLGISLMLSFIPRFFSLWELSNLACEARSCKRGPRRLVILIPLVTERMMEAAADTALALQARAVANER